MSSNFTVKFYRQPLRTRCLFCLTSSVSILHDLFRKERGTKEPVGLKVGKLYLLGRGLIAVKSVLFKSIYAYYFDIELQSFDTLWTWQQFRFSYHGMYIFSMLQSSTVVPNTSHHEDTSESRRSGDRRANAPTVPLPLQAPASAQHSMDCCICLHLVASYAWHTTVCTVSR